MKENKEMEGKGIKLLASAMYENIVGKKKIRR